MSAGPFLDVNPHDTGRRWWDDVPIKVGTSRIDVTVVSDGEAITAIHFGASKSRKSTPIDGWVRDPKAVREAADQLARYGEGDLKDFDLPLRPSGTPFQMDVWAELAAIPYGSTTTYGRVADAIGRRGSGRAVGSAVGSNPIGIVIPCHRVIGANGALTGFGGGLDNKVILLRREGVTAF